MRRDCCSPDNLQQYCPPTLPHQPQPRSSSLCRQYHHHQQQQQHHHHHTPVDCNSLNRLSKPKPDICRACIDGQYAGDNAIPTSLGVVVIPIASKSQLNHQQHQQQHVSIMAKSNNCSLQSLAYNNARDCCQNEPDYLDMASVR